MAIRIYTISVTVPPGTLPAAPQVTPWVTEDEWVDTIEIEVPPGHNGLTGIRLVKADIQVLPFGMNTWLIENDYVRVFPLDQYLPTTDLVIQAYNQGSYPHTFYLRLALHTYVRQQQAALSGSPVLPESAASAVSDDPLSPDQLLGSETASALTSGAITAADVAPVSGPDITVPPEPVRTGT